MQTMTTDTTYNGWINYETWCVALWLDNEEGSQTECVEKARELLQDAIDRDDEKSDAITEMADWLEALHDETMPDVAGVFGDLLRAALGATNWREIASHYIDDIDVFAAGWNMPGYVPDNTPAMFLDADDAMQYIKDEMTLAIEDSEDATDEERASVDDIDAFKGDSAGEFGRTVGAYHYFVSKV